MTLVLLLLGCDDPEGDGEDEDGRKIERFDTGDSGDRPERGRARIAGFGARCDDGIWTATVLTSAETSGIAVIDVWSTGGAQAWHEEHLAVAVGSGSGGERLEVTVPAAETIGCSDDPADLTFAVRVYDRRDRLGDCVATGHVPGCVAHGDCGDAGGVASLPGELFACLPP